MQPTVTFVRKNDSVLVLRVPTGMRLRIGTDQYSDARWIITDHVLGMLKIANPSVAFVEERTETSA